MFKNRVEWKSIDGDRCGITFDSDLQALEFKKELITKGEALESQIELTEDIED